MDAKALAAATKDPIGRLGGGFMTSRESKRFGEQVGLSGWAPYMRGRGGVLGDVDAAVVHAAFTFFPFETVRDAWEAGRGLPAADAVRGYTSACREHAERKLAALPDAEVSRLGELLDRVAVGSGAAGAPLFAGWRAVPLPEPGRGRVGQLCHVLREYRGGMHAIAVLAAGMAPLTAMVTDEHPPTAIGTGAQIAGFFGWSTPLPEPTADDRTRRVEVEERTDDLTAPAFRVLTGAESDELATLLPHAADVAYG